MLHILYLAHFDRGSNKSTKCKIHSVSMKTISYSLSDNL